MLGGRPRADRSRAARPASRGTTSRRRKRPPRSAKLRVSHPPASGDSSSVAAGPADACRAAVRTDDGEQISNAGAEQSTGPPRLNVTEPRERGGGSCRRSSSPCGGRSCRAASPARLRTRRGSPGTRRVSRAGPTAVRLMPIATTVPKRARQRPLRPSNEIVPVGAARSAVLLLFAPVAELAGKRDPEGLPCSALVRPDDGGREVPPRLRQRRRGDEERHVVDRGRAPGHGEGGSYGCGQTVRYDPSSTPPIVGTVRPRQSGSKGISIPSPRPSSTARVSASEPKRSRTSSTAASSAPSLRGRTAA